MFALNKLPAYGSALLPQDGEHFTAKSLSQARTFAESRDGYAPTPLVQLRSLADRLGIEQLSIKDESTRFGLGSFKALGGTYAVVRTAIAAAAQATGRPVSIEEWHSPEFRERASGMTFGCATDGNHGKSVAAGARILGAQAKIFVHAGVSAARIVALEMLGAEVIRVDGNYDASIEEATRVCLENGWSIVSDTSWPGYEEVPGWVMEGYTPLLLEALEQLPRPPTHVFVQAGVGGIAACISGTLDALFGEARPRVIVVEPSRADCLFQSLVARRPIQISSGEPTIMAMLECFEPSLVAWRILERTADAFMTVEEEDALAAMNTLARPHGSDMAIVSGESGCVGLAGLSRAMADRDVANALGLNASSRVLLINTEGATDPERYQSIVGVSASSVARSETI
ncbi:diaminopropionate ammonia-lyase [Devosia sp. 2618]|uniref:diaminopropionate ammonia-lyase n=1 Tax=Devosia sp. 2618 TaxID=3156454 RepID=UPI0033946DB6